MPSRRSFVGQSVTAGVTASALLEAASLAAASSHPHDPLIVAVIGTGVMGSNHLSLLAARKDVRVAYVCDVDSNPGTSATTASTRSTLPGGGWA